MQRFDLFRRLTSKQDSSHRGNPLFVKDRTRERRRQWAYIVLGGLVIAGCVASSSYVYTKNRERAGVVIEVQGLLDTSPETITNSAKAYAEDRLWNGRQRYDSKKFKDETLRLNIEQTAPVTVKSIERITDGRKLRIVVADNVMAVVVESAKGVVALDAAGKEIYTLNNDEYTQWQQAKHESPRLQRMAELPRIRLIGSAQVESRDAQFVVSAENILRHNNLPISYFTKKTDGSGSIVSTIPILIDYREDPEQQLNAFTQLWSSFDDATKSSLSYIDVRFGRRVYYK